MSVMMKIPCHMDSFIFFFYPPKKERAHLNSALILLKKKKTKISGGLLLLFFAPFSFFYPSTLYSVSSSLIPLRFFIYTHTHTHTFIMFWRFGFHNPSAVDTLLDREDVTLEEILEEEEILQETKSHNQRLIDLYPFLCCHYHIIYLWCYCYGGLNNSKHHLSHTHSYLFYP